MRTGIRSGVRGLAIVLVLAASVSACWGDGSASDDAAITTTTEDVQAPLVGSWQRSGGDYSVLQGMVVEVDEEGTEGTIVSVARNPYEFQVGDTKWRSISAISEGLYRFEDLSRESGTGSTSYLSGVMTLSTDGLVLKMSFPTTGTTQTWTRVD